MTREQLANKYAEEENSCYTNDYYGFLAGFEAGAAKWIKVEDDLPNTDRTVICYAENKETPLWSGLKLGSYIDSRWYCNGGIYNHEIITKWQEVAE